MKTLDKSVMQNDLLERTDASENPATSILRVAAARTQKATCYLQGHRQGNLV